MSDPHAAEPKSRSAPSRRRPGALAISVVAAVLGVAAVAGASALTWWTAAWSDPLVGAVITTARGTDTVPELLPVALVGLAGWAAAAAVRGPWRRVVGVVLALAGAWLAVRAVLGALDPPGVLTSVLVRPADPVGDPVRQWAGPGLAVLGGLLLVAAGLVLALRRPSPARPVGGPPATAPTAGTGAARRRDAGDTTDDWWKDLDAGRDPTLRPPGGES